MSRRLRNFPVYCWRGYFGVCLLLLISTTLHGQENRSVVIEAFPPETEIRVFMPGSPPKDGDLIPNNTAFDATGSYEIPVRLSAPGYISQELNLGLLKANETAPGRWEFHYELIPRGLFSMVRHEFRRYPARSYGGLALATAVLLGAGIGVRRKVFQGQYVEQAARKAVEAEAETQRKKLDELDPNIIGRVIDSYRVTKLLGEGAYAKVYKAVHVDYGDTFVLKMLRPELLDDRVQERIEREMSIGRDLVHPHLVRTFGYGTFRDAPYLVMEFIDGMTLDERYDEGPLTIAEAIDLTKQIAQGLEYAHSQGVVHRDLKPANLFINQDGLVKILDFGVAKILDDERRLTLTGQALGTPHYMSPEQARGRASTASDVYALGTILFEMLTEVPPFEGETALEVITAHTFGGIPSPRELVSTVPEQLDALVQHMMAKEPDDRPASMPEILRRLEEVKL